MKIEVFMRNVTLIPTVNTSSTRIYYYNEFIAIYSF